MIRKTLQMQATLSASQRQTILGREGARQPYEPPTRKPNATPGITYHAASVRGIYRSGDGDVIQHIRPGAEQAAGLRSRGF